MVREKIRLYLDSKIFPNEKIKILDNYYHYCFRVMRAKINDLIIIFNEKDGEWEASIHQDYFLPLKLIREIQNSEENHLLLLIAQVPISILKIAIRQATELGINSIDIINTDFCNRNSNINFEKLRRISIEATEQSKRLTIPVISDKIHSIDYWLNNFPEKNDLIFCDENLSNQKNYKNTHNQSQNNKVILIGPEGGFSPREQKLLVNFPNIIRIKLSDNILRVETAVVAAITMVKNR